MDLVPHIDPEPFNEFLDRLYEGTDLRGHGPMGDGALKASDVYFDFVRWRFDVYSERGGDWPEHAPSTIKRRGVGAPILLETGQLRESLERNSSGHIEEIESGRVIEGTEDFKARGHQDGAPERNLPARPILVPPPEQILDEMKEPLVSAFDDLAHDAAGESSRPLPEITFGG